MIFNSKLNMSSYSMVNLFYLDHNPKKCASYYCDKHVIKILVEILQILSQIHHNIGTKKPTYKKCKAIHSTLAPYVWASHSVGNYKYCIELAKALLNEYKFRYNKNTHRSEKALVWLENNIPQKIILKNKTKFLLTNNVRIYSDYFKNIITASRYLYVDFKCSEDKWTNRSKPEWFISIDRELSLKKNILIEKILINVKQKLPLFSKKYNLKPRRFHSFLRICYDNLFQDFWKRKIKSLGNMFNEKKPLLYQLGYPHLLRVYEISNSLFDLFTFNKLNHISLSYRGKL